MARLPQPGGDDGTWGQVLNDYLSQSLDLNGNIKPGAVQAGALAPNAVTSTSLAVASGSDGQVLIKDSAVTSGFKWGTVSVGASAATSSSLGTVQLAGDLSGTATAPTVPGLATKEPVISAGLNSQYYRGDKSWQSLDKAAVGLGNVDNTTDANKPVSAATQTALNGKSNTGHTHAVGDVTGLQTALDGKAAVSSLATVATSGSYNDLTNKPTIPSALGSTDNLAEGTTNLYYTNARAAAAAPVASVAGRTGAVVLAKADVGLGNVDNTTDLNKPISTATQTALNGKASSSHTHAINDVTGLQTALDSKANAADVGAKVLLIDNAAALPAGTPAGVIVVVKA